MEFWATHRWHGPLEPASFGNIVKIYILEIKGGSFPQKVQISYFWVPNWKMQQNNCVNVGPKYLSVLQPPPWSPLLCYCSVSQSSRKRAANSQVCIFHKKIIPQLVSKYFNLFKYNRGVGCVQARGGWYTMHWGRRLWMIARGGGGGWGSPHF